ncbi:MAG TPA: hypothetical protein VFG11_03560 [Acidobacteriota bacterium]|nr:hypothetical protein [Acidobacteriota bacterium]
MLRSILSIVFGHFVFSVGAAAIFWLSGTDPNAAAPWLTMVLTTIIGMLFALLAGYLTALTAPRRPQLHANILACLLVVEALASMILQYSSAAIWTQIAAIVLMAPLVSLGGRVRKASLVSQAS